MRSARGSGSRWRDLRPLTDEVLDRIDEIVPPGTEAGALDQAYVPPALLDPELRRRPLHLRSAA